MKRPLIASPAWTPEEDHLLRTLAEQGISRVEIAKRFGRSKNSIGIRATKLGVSLKQIARGKPPQSIQSPRLRCENCDGMGRFDDHFCHVCDGRGYTVPAKPAGPPPQKEG